MVLKIAGPAALSLLFAGCQLAPVQVGWMPASPGVPLNVGPTGPPAYDSTHDIERIRQAYNKGGCQEIYDSASEHFRQRESEKDWSILCGQIRTNFGDWLSFSPGVITEPRPEACKTQGSEDFEDLPINGVDDWARADVEGTGIFASGKYSVAMDWILEGGRAGLLHVYLWGSGVQVSAPPPPVYGSGHPLMDPPPPDRSGGRKS
jgi:hypothetical protein